MRLGSLWYCLCGLIWDIVVFRISCGSIDMDERRLCISYVTFANIILEGLVLDFISHNNRWMVSLGKVVLLFYDTGWKDHVLHALLNLFADVPCLNPLLTNPVLLHTATPLSFPNLSRAIHPAKIVCLPLKSNRITI